MPKPIVFNRAKHNAEREDLFATEDSQSEAVITPKKEVDKISPKKDIKTEKETIASKRSQSRGRPFLNGVSRKKEIKLNVNLDEDTLAEVDYIVTCEQEKCYLSVKVTRATIFRTLLNMGIKSWKQLHAENKRDKDR